MNILPPLVTHPSSIDSPLPWQVRQVVEALKDGTKVAPTATGSVRLKGGLKDVSDSASAALPPLTIQTVTEELIVSGEGMTSKLRKSSADSQVLRQKTEQFFS